MANDQLLANPLITHNSIKKSELVNVVTFDCVTVVICVVGINSGLRDPNGSNFSWYLCLYTNSQAVKKCAVPKKPG